MTILGARNFRRRQRRRGRYNIAAMSDRHHKPATGTIRIGISGWTYAPWRGTFYPKKLPRKNELAYAGEVLSSIEINGTFYGLQKPKSFATWYEQTPADFVFAVKAPRFLTHIKRLRDVRTPMANFLLSGVLRLNEKLGPILWQLPPNMQFQPDVFETFVSELPRSTSEAAKLVKHCDARMKGRSWAEIDRDRPLRHAVEIRHESFASDKFIRLLRKNNIALVCADTADKWPMLHDVTADFVYARLHGAEELYASGYTDAALDDWAVKIRAWAHGGDAPLENRARAGGSATASATDRRAKAHDANEADDHPSASAAPVDATSARRIGPGAPKRATRDVYVYFDNDVKVRSPFDAARLATKLGLRDQPLEEPRKTRRKEIPRQTWPGVKREKK